MTCEIAVMNKCGLALAADSATTVGRGDKIYHHAQKVFPLQSGAPVAIMIYGSAEIMAAPWELVIHAFSAHLGARRFATVQLYADEFFRFAESAAELFPADLQREWFRDSVGRYWYRTFAEPLEHRLKSQKAAPSAIMKELLASDHALWLNYAEGEKRDATHADKMLKQYALALNQVEHALFGVRRLNAHVKEGLRETARLMHTRQWIDPSQQTGIVFAGLGDSEPFPVLLDYSVGAVAAGRLRRFKSAEARVSREDSAIVAPFAQNDMADMFYRGIVPELEQRLSVLVGRCASHVLNNDAKKTDKAGEKIANAFIKALDAEIDGRFSRPLIAAVDALPRHDLARIAEALVSLTALRRRMSLDERETVGGAIDVAILSKAEGFVWSKRAGRTAAHA